MFAKTMDIASFDPELAKAIKGERQRQEDQHRPDDGIDDRQHETRRQHGQTAADFDPRQDIGGGEDRQRIREHPDQKAHAAPFKRAYFF